MTSKIKTVQELQPLLEILRASGKKTVFTNGCFDLIHTGHTRYLAIARPLGDLLVVAVNSDSSVSTIKGDKRPITPQAERAETLAALQSVDYVTIFDEPDPLRAAAPHCRVDRCARGRRRTVRSDERLRATLDGAQDRSATGLAAATIAAVDRFAGNAPAADDIIVLALRYRGPAPG